MLCNPFVLGKFTPVVRCDSLEQFPFIGYKQSPDGLCQRHSFFPLFEFLHNKEVCAPFYHRQDGVTVLVNDKIHLPVSESLSIGFCRTFMYADTVADIDTLGLMPYSTLTMVFHFVSAVGCRLPAGILTDEFIDGLMGNFYALFSFQIHGNLLERPLLVLDILLDTPP